jgi:hypothetical protein
LGATALAFEGVATVLVVVVDCFFAPAAVVVGFDDCFASRKRKQTKRYKEKKRIIINIQ